MQPDDAIPRGIEWVIDATGCDPALLASSDALARLFSALIDALALHPLSEPAWHRFPGHGGITGFCLLAESHLACHTFPEYGSACLNLFCCKPRPEADWKGLLGTHLGAAQVSVSRLARRY